VYVGGTFTMSGGKISGNTASSSSIAGGYGGGVAVSFGAFTMNDGEISGNTAASRGGGVDVSFGTFTKKGGTIYGDTDKIAGNGNATDNTSTSGEGHAVQPGGGSKKRRNATAGPELKLFYDESGNVSTFIDSSEGGVGDTTANWEE
jgi:hypothetical protein